MSAARARIFTAILFALVLIVQAWADYTALFYTPVYLWYAVLAATLALYLYAAFTRKRFAAGLVIGSLAVSLLLAGNTLIDGYYVFPYSPTLLIWGVIWFAVSLILCLTGARLVQRMRFGAAAR